METRSTFDVLEGRPSWHQQRAGGACAAVTSGFPTREAAERHAERYRESHPGEPATVVERAIVMHEGREFTASGSFTSIEHGIVTGYVKRTPCGGWDLTTWHGERIAELRFTGYARGFHGTRLECYSMTLAGYSWHGRGLGAGMHIAMRRGRAVKVDY